MAIRRLAEGMLMFTFSTTPVAFRILHRAPLDDGGPCCFHAAKKPSVLDLYLDGDAHVAWRRDEVFDVFVGHLRLASPRGTRLDEMTFNTLLFQIRG